MPLQVLVDKFSHVRFEPSGMTKNPEIPFAKSIVDYVFRWMAHEVPVGRGEVPRRAERARAGEAGPDAAGQATLPLVGAPLAGPALAGTVRAAPAPFAAIQNQEDAPPCTTCGAIMVRSGACYKCSNCGTTSGCA